MKESFELKAVFNASPTEIYDAWLDGEKHGHMTGGEAHCSDKEGGKFSVSDGYIWGINLELHRPDKIVQSWRTSEFETEEEDSRLELQFGEKDGGTELTLIHSNIPEGQTQYLQGWVDHYFTPMKEYFG